MVRPGDFCVGGPLESAAYVRSLPTRPTNAPATTSAPSSTLSGSRGNRRVAGPPETRASSFGSNSRLVARALEHSFPRLPCPVAAPRVRADRRQRDITVRRVRARCVRQVRGIEADEYDFVQPRAVAHDTGRRILRIGGDMRAAEGEIAWRDGATFLRAGGIDEAVPGLRTRIAWVALGGRAAGRQARDGCAERSLEQLAARTRAGAGLPRVHRVVIRHAGKSTPNRRVWPVPAPIERPLNR